LSGSRANGLAAPRVDRGNWLAIVEVGWLALAACVPENLGGYGGSIIESLLIHEGAGAGLIIEPLLSAGLAARLASIALPKSEAERILAPLLAGDALWAVAHEEPDARGDSSVVEATARLTGDVWTLCGSKSMVLGAPSADGLLVSARVNSSSGDATEIALFRLDRPQFADRLKSCRTLDGQQAADLDLHGLSVAEESRIGAERCALPALVEACAEAVGAMDAAIGVTAEHLKNRKQFGAPLATFQALQHKLADMVIAAEQARSILLYGAAGAAQGNAAERGRAVSAAKVLTIDSAHVVGKHAIQLHGGIGVTEEHLISHYFRKLFAFVNRFGGSDRHLARFIAD
jgi:alkylation response protein AidB-like acyl-CoA dehydrogenase